MTHYLASLWDTQTFLTTSSKKYLVNLLLLRISNYVQKFNNNKSTYEEIEVLSKPHFRAIFETLWALLTREDFFWKIGLSHFSFFMTL